MCHKLERTGTGHRTRIKHTTKHRIITIQIILDCTQPHTFCVKFIEFCNVIRIATCNITITFSGLMTGTLFERLKDKKYEIPDKHSNADREQFSTGWLYLLTSVHLCNNKVIHPIENNVSRKKHNQ